MYPEGSQLWSEYIEMYRVTISEPWGIDRRLINKTVQLVGNYIGWAQILTVYTTAKLSYESDTLVALSALAKEWSVILKDDYVAGLWKKGFARQFVWRACGNLTRPRRYRAPSWLWASVNGSIENLAIFSPDESSEERHREASAWSFKAEILEVCTVAAGFDNNTGQLSGGYLEAQGLGVESSVTIWQREKHHNGVEGFISDIEKTADKWVLPSISCF